MQNDRSCPLVEQYLGYLITIKGRSNNTIIEYRTDILHFLGYVASTRKTVYDDFKFADLEFIKSITLADMYSFIAYCQNTLNSAPGTRARKIVSIRLYGNFGNISRLRHI